MLPGVDSAIPTNPPEWVRLLVRAGCHAPSADNSQPWRFEWDGRTLTLRLDQQRGGSGLGLEHPANLMAMGAAVENLVQAAAAVGLPGSAVRLGLGRDGEPFATIASDGAVALSRNAAGLPLFRRHTNRGSYLSTALDPALSARLASMTEGDARAMVASGASERQCLVNLVKDASEVRFQTEEIHRWLGASLRFTREEVERGDGLDVATLMLPPGATGLLKFSLDWKRMALLNRLGAYKLFAVLEAAMLKQCGTILTIVGTADRGGAVAAGRLLERVWIALNEAGLAVHPYYVLSDQLYRLRADRVAGKLRPAVTALANRTAALLGSPEETIFMLLRVGLPRQVELVRSRRLPESVTFSSSRTP
jgi:hypothetical protein